MTDLNGVPIQVTSSKPLLGRYQGRVNFEYDGQLTFETVSTTLSGSVKNPFDFELTNCAVFYKNFLIPIESNLGPNEEFDLSFGRQQDLQSFLKRRVKNQDTDDNEIKEINTMWDKSDLDVPRILRMMMFFDAAGGRVYTELTNDYMTQVDMSALLDSNRAMLIGRIRSAATPLTVDGKQTSANIDKKWTVVRVLFPVKEIKR